MIHEHDVLRDSSFTSRNYTRSFFLRVSTVFGRPEHDVLLDFKSQLYLKALGRRSFDFWGIYCFFWQSA